MICFLSGQRVADVRAVYSPLDAVQIAKDNPDKEVVFFAIGFETTAPANAMSVIKAKSLGLTNFSDPGFTSTSTPGNGIHSFFTPQPGARVPGCRACVRHHGILGIHSDC